MSLLGLSLVRVSASVFQRVFEVWATGLVLCGCLRVE